MAARAERTRSFFDAVGPEWDALRKVFNDDAAARARGRAAGAARPARRRRRHRHRHPRRSSWRGSACASSRSTTRRACSTRRARKLSGRARTDVELRARRGERAAARRRARSTRRSRTWCCTTCPRPPRRSARWRASVRPGGSVVVVDFVQPRARVDAPGARRAWLGFDAEEIEALAREPPGLVDATLRVQAGRSRARDLPRDRSSPRRGRAERRRRGRAAPRAVLLRRRGHADRAARAGRRDLRALRARARRGVPAARLEDAFARVLRAAPPLVFPGAARATRARARERGWWRERVRADLPRRRSASRASTTSRPSSTRLFAHYASGAAWRARAGRADALAALRAAGVATGGRLELRPAPAPASSRDLGLARASTRSCCPRDAGAAKPDRAIFDARLARLGLAAPTRALRRRRRGARPRRRARGRAAARSTSAALATLGAICPARSAAARESARSHRMSAPDRAARSSASASVSTTRASRARSAPRSSGASTTRTSSSSTRRSDAVALEEGIVKSGDRHVEQGVGVRALAGERRATRTPTRSTRREPAGSRRGTARAISATARGASARGRGAAGARRRAISTRVATPPTDVAVARKVELARARSTPTRARATRASCR